MAKFTFLEFFAGGGMARAGLGPTWRCLFANDFDARKVSTYKANWGGGDINWSDVANLALADLPSTSVDLAWASFPCQDLSLAGSYRGLGRERDNARTRSGTFWPFWRLMRALAKEGRAPWIIVLENVCGALTSHGGKDFEAIGGALVNGGYRFGVLSEFANYNATYGALGAVVGLMVWMWMSAIVILVGAELNSEIEHQTATDSTVHGDKPLGRRGAAMADTVGAPAK